MEEDLFDFGENSDRTERPAETIWDDLEQLDRLAHAVSFFVSGQLRLAQKTVSPATDGRSVKLAMFAVGVAEEMMRLAGIESRADYVARVVYLSLLIAGEERDALALTRQTETLRLDPAANIYSLYGRTAVQMLVREDDDAMHMYARALDDRREFAKVS